MTKLEIEMNTTNDKPEALIYAECAIWQSENGCYERALFRHLGETVESQHAEIQRLRIEREAMLEQIVDLGGEVREPELQEIRARRAEIQLLTAERDAARRALADIHEACQHSPYRGDGSWDAALAALINHHARLLPATEAINASR